MHSEKWPLVGNELLALGLAGWRLKREALTVWLTAPRDRLTGFGGYVTLYLASSNYSGGGDQRYDNKRDIKLGDLLYNTRIDISNKKIHKRDNHVCHH